MTSGRDYQDEMFGPDLIDDATAEALLAGLPVRSELEQLAQLLQAMHETSRRPVRPTGELAAAMAVGVFSGEGVMPAPGDRRRRGRRRAAAGAGARRNNWRNTPMAAAQVLAALIAKVAGLSAAAKAATGLSIAAGSMTAAGFGGALPESVQQQFESTVETITPYEFPQDTPGNADFGEEVSEDAKDGGVDGGEVSEKAKELGNQPDQPGNPPSTLPTPAQTPAGEPASTPSASPSQRPTDTPSGPPSGLPSGPPTGDTAPTTPSVP